MLVVHHGGREHLVRQRQELLGEGPGHHRGVFHQIGHLLMQGRLPVERRQPSAGLGGGLLQLAGDAVAPVRPVDQHVVVRQTLPVIGERHHLDRRSRRTVAGKEPVPVGDVAGPDRRHTGHHRSRGPADLERHDLGGVQEHQPTDRTTEQKLAAAVFEKRIPAHGFRKRQVAQRRGEDAAQHGLGVVPGLAAMTGEVLALGGLDAGQRSDVHPLLAGESDGGARRLAVGIEPGADGRAGHRLLQIGLPFRKLRHRGHQPPRGHERPHRGAALDPCLVQVRRQTLDKLRLDARNPARGHLLATDLQEQLPVLHRYASPTRSTGGRPANAAWSASLPPAVSPAAPAPDN